VPAARLVGLLAQYDPDRSPVIDVVRLGHEAQSRATLLPQVLYAFDPSERAVAGVRKREWQAVASR